MMMWEYRNHRAYSKMARREYSKMARREFIIDDI
jgi:hypothetical protein